MMTAEKFSSHCIFCTNQCPSRFTIINGKPVKLKIENETESKPFLSSDFDSGAPDDSSIESHLRVIFILRKILNVDVSTLPKFLGNYEGQFHPGLWISLCSSCDQLVGEFWEKLKEIGRLETRLKGIKSELTGLVQHTQAFNGNGAGEDPVWNEIRKIVLAEAGTGNDFEEKFHIESVMVTTPENQDKIADEDGEDRFPESDGEEPLIRVELLGNNQYKNAEELDDPTYQCDPLSCSNLQEECGKSFKTESNHVNTVHKQDPIPCPYCQVVFNHKNNLKRHLRMNHSEEEKTKPATCSKCGKSFSRWRNVSRHIREVHGFAPKQFNCSECNVVVKSKQQLSHHMKAIHNPETHVCPICENIFATAKYLNQHVTRTHPSPAQKESWAKCPNCEMRFCQKYLFKRHLLHSSCRLGKREETKGAEQQE